MSLSHKLLDPKNDIAFKRIFGTERNKAILIHFLNDMLIFKDNVIIKDIKYLPTIQDPEIASQKTSIVDVMCEDTEGNIYIVEMQVAKTEGFQKRAQYYAAKAYSSQARIGSAYENLKEVIFIAIADYVMFPNKKEIKSDHIILDKLTYAHDLKDFSFTFLELPKFKKGEKELDQLEDTIEKWCYFFKYAEDIDPEVLNRILKENSTILEKAVQELIRYNWTADELCEYEQAEKRKNDLLSSLSQKFNEGHQEGLEKGEAIGLEKGKAEGERKKTQEIVLTMLQNGLDDTLIMNLTKITLEELNVIKASVKTS